MKLKMFLKNNIHLLINVLILITLLVLLCVFNYQMFVRFRISLKFLFCSFIEYIGSLFNFSVFSNYSSPFDDVLNVMSGGEVLGITKISFPLTSSFDKFLSYFNSSFLTVFNLDYFLNFFGGLGSFISNFNVIFFVFISLLLCLFLLNIIVFSNQDPEKVGYTRGFVRWNNFYNRWLIKIEYFIRSFIDYLKEHRLFIFAYLFIALFFSNVLNIFIDFFGYYFQFATYFNPVIIFEFVYSSLYCLWPILSIIPLWLFLIIVYLIFDFLRVRRAINKLCSLDYKNRDFIEERTGVVNVVTGFAGSGKTKLVTDLGRSAEQLFRYNLLDTLNKYQSYFPNFDFHNFESFILEYKIKGLLNNKSQIEDFILERKNKFFELFESDDPDFDDLLNLTFNYDFRHYRMSYYNGLIEISFFDFLKEYASAFFYYSLENPLLFSNYSINVVSLKVNSEYFPLWQYPYFSIDGKTLNYIGHFSHIVNMDSLRLGKKFDCHTGILGFGVVCFCEFNNERGNQKTNVRFKYDDYSPNPINDEMNKYLKLARHPAVIDYKSYFKLFTDMQRVGDTSLSTVELAEAIIFIKSKIKNNSLFLRVFEPIICGFLSNLRDKFVVKYRMSRNYYSLFYCLVLFFLDPFKRYLERRENMFGYEKILLDVSSGLDEVKEEYSYYLLNKKALANAYATDTHYGFFKRNLNAQSYSIDDISCYKKLHADFDELKSQNSYLVNDLDNVFKDESDGDNL